MHVEFKYQNESLLHLSSRLNSLNTRRKSTARAYLGPRENYIVSSRVSVPHPIFRLPHPFLPIPLPKKNILNMSSAPFKSNAPQNFGKLTSSLKSTLVRKCKDSFFKERKDFITNNEIPTIWTLKYKYPVANSKNQRRVRLVLRIVFLLGS